MRDVNIQLRFSGPELIAHTMDVTLLGPVLLSLGELSQEANHVLNGDKARVRVLLNSDIKANCITIDLQVVQTTWQAAQSLISNADVASAKDILEWIGILSSSGATLLKFLQWKKNRKESSTEIRQENGGNIVVVHVEGDNNSITIPEQVYKLSKSVKAVESVKSITAPVANELGINEAVFLYDNKETVKIDKTFAEDLQQSHADTEDNEPQTFTAHIVIYGPVLDPKAKHWKFKLNDRVESVDISRTKIAEKALARGGISIGDTYKVKMEMTEKKTRNGDYRADFAVKEVIEFIPGQHFKQTVMPL
jgi:hypothetical protein